MDRRRLIGGCLAVLCLAAGLMGCRPQPQASPEPPPAPVAASAPTIAPTPPAGRADLLRAAAEAADAVASGQAMAPGTLAGRPFSLRLPFGCAGEDPEGAPLRFAFEEEARTLRLSAAVQDWTQAPWAQALVGSVDAEAIEGFWIRRPWLTGEGCPGQPVQPGALISPETVAVAEVFEAGASRVGRRAARPYTVTRKLDPDQAPGPGGFRLVLEGRLAAERPVRCVTDHPDRRPTCLILAQFDRVAFEDAKGEVLAEWAGPPKAPAGAAPASQQR